MYHRWLLLYAEEVELFTVIEVNYQAFTLSLFYSRVSFRVRSPWMNEKTGSLSSVLYFITTDR